LANWDNQPGLFGDRNELVRKHKCQGGMLPRTNASTPSIAPVLKLIMGW
jgi:hypothetical protein